MASYGKKIAAVLFIMLCLSITMNVVFYGWMESLHKKVNELNRENLMLKESLEVLKRNLEYHPTNVSLIGDNWIYIAGVVTSQSGTHEGEILRIYARLVDGMGKVFIATNPKIGIDLQASAETAFKTAQQISKIEIYKFDCMLTVVANRSIEVVDGPSAGAAITILLTLLLQGKEIRRDVIITGTIQSDGTIGAVGGIIEKATAAAKNGAAFFIVPKGQSKATVYVEEVTRIGQIIEASNIREALEYFSK